MVQCVFHFYQAYRTIAVQICTHESITNICRQLVRFDTLIAVTVELLKYRLLEFITLTQLVLQIQKFFDA